MVISTIEKTMPRKPSESHENPIKRGRMVLAILIGLNCMLFVAGLILPKLREALMLHSPAVPVPPLATALINWRAMASYTFVHAGPTHLIFNMIFLWITGNYILTRCGTKRMILYYIAGAAAGGLGFLTVSAFFPAGRITSLCGASAAVLGLCGAILQSHPADRRILIITWIAIGVSLLGTLTGPSIATHLFGLLAGMAAARMIKKLQKAASRPEHL